MGIFRLFAPARPPRPARRPASAPAVPFRERVAQAEASQTGDWSKVRSPERSQDQALSDIADRWMAGLPPNVRPHVLAQRYPRIANRLALCWKDRELVGPMLEDLLVDKRGNRQGFPPAVAADLRKLQAYFSSRHAASDPGCPWSPDAMAVVDR